VSVGGDWTVALGAPGTIVVTELVRYDDLGRSSRERPGALIELASTEVAGRRLACTTLGWRRLGSVDGQVAATLDLERRPGEVEGGGWSKPMELLGEQTRATLCTDSSRGSRLRGPLRYLSVGDGRWCWHFVGGRTAGEELVLARGREPGGDPVVRTFPAAQGRSLGRTAGGATFDRHVTSWSSDAELREVLLAELFATAKLDGLVDYRAARVMEGVQELTGYVPRVEGNTE